MDIQLNQWILLMCFTSQWTLTHSYPECTDKLPPFKLEEKEIFCSQYQKSGCCTMTRNNQLLIKYKDIVQKINSIGLGSTCSDMIKEIICQECSPYSAQMFQAESKPGMHFPGLCDNFCRNFHAKCKEVVQYFTTDQTLIAAASISADKFCSAINKLPDQTYCYPKLLKNAELNKDLQQRQTSSNGDCLCLKELDRNLERPLLLISPDDGTKRIFLGSQIGEVFIYDNNGTKLADSFIDIRDLVVTTKFRGDHRGLLGMAFHSDFKSTQKFYVHFTREKHDGSGQLVSQISELKTLENNRDKADITSYKAIINIDQPSDMDNGGQLIFGTDGYLYVFLGDGQDGSGDGTSDPANYAQNRSSLLGKILRIDVDSMSEQRVYSIPPDNPFIHETGARHEVFAYGFKNPVRGDEDEGDPVTGYGKGRIFVGDVGKSTWEEINLVKKGGNYGWSAKEGNDCYKPELCSKLGSDIRPIHLYHHNSSDGHVVIGGHMYRGCLNPALNGLYMYGDYATGKLFSLKETFQGSDVWGNKELQMCDVCPHGLTNNYHSHIMGFGEDYDGEIYVISNDDGTGKSGSVHKIYDPRRRGDPGMCRSNRQRGTLVDIEVDKVTQTNVTPTWPYWLMLLSSVMGFCGGIMTVYCIIRNCPKWGAYRRLLRVRSVSGHRSEQNLNGFTDHI